MMQTFVILFFIYLTYCSVKVSGCRVGVSENICQGYGDMLATCRVVTCQDSLWQPTSPANAPYEVSTTHCQCMCSDGVSSDRATCLGQGKGVEWTIGPYTCSNGVSNTRNKCIQSGANWIPGIPECTVNPQTNTTKTQCTTNGGSWVIYGSCSDGLVRKTQQQCSNTKATWAVGSPVCLNKHGHTATQKGGREITDQTTCIKRKFTWQVGVETCSHPGKDIIDEASCVNVR